MVSSDCKNKFDLKKKEIKQQKTCYSCLSLKKTKLMEINLNVCYVQSDIKKGPSYYRLVYC